MAKRNKKKHSVVKEFMLKRPIADKPYLWLKNHRDYVPTIERITYWFNVLNKEIFKGELPPFKEIKIQRKRGRWADCYSDEERESYYAEWKRYSILSIESKLINEHQMVEILAHEMIHHWQWMHHIRVGHGDSFFKWQKKFSKLQIPLDLYVRLYYDVGEYNGNGSRSS